MRSSVASRAQADRRASPRVPCFLDAVALPRHQACVVVDRSETGFRIKFHQPYAGQTNLTIVLTASGEAFATSVRWVDGNEIGALVTAQCDLKGMVTGAFAEARHVWRALKAKPGSLEISEA